MKKTSFLWVLVAFFVYSCVTVNIYFPAQEAQKTAKEIVNSIRGSVNVQKKQNKSPSPSSFLIIVPRAYAADVLNTTNAKIAAIKQRMKKRFEFMKPYYQKGYLGEGLNGYLVIYKQPKSLKDKLRLKKFVSDENRDRNALYSEVARVLKIQPSQMDRLKRIFAKQWQDTAPKGTYIQTVTGWVRK